MKTDKSDKKCEQNKNIDKKWGYDFPEIIDALKRTIDKIDLTPNESHTIVIREKIIVAHDWGCFYSYCFDHQFPGYIKAMVALDVGAYANITMPIAIYQLTLALAFLLGKPLGGILTRRFLKKIGYKSPWEKAITPALNYPYYFLWRNVWRSKFCGDKGFLKGYKPSFPVSFIYGKDKPFQFQNKKWLDWIERNQGSYVGVEGGHWVMEKHGDLIEETVRGRIKGLRAKL